MIASIATFAGGLPNEIKVAIAVAVLYLIRLVLIGRVPDEWITELAGIITTAVVAAIELALGLIPAQFDAIVAAVLQVIAILLGSVLVVNAYRLLKVGLRERGMLH